jgi:hypothetical protein
MAPKKSDEADPEGGNGFNEESYVAFARKLEEAFAPPPSHTTYIGAVSVVAEFFDMIYGRAAPELSKLIVRRLHRLGLELSDEHQGIPSKMLRGKKRSKGGKPESSAEWANRTDAALALEARVKCGDVALKQAATELARARESEARKLARSNKGAATKRLARREFTWKTLVTWRKRFQEGDIPNVLAKYMWTIGSDRIEALKVSKDSVSKKGGREVVVAIVNNELKSWAQDWIRRSVLSADERF